MQGHLPIPRADNSTSSCCCIYLCKTEKSLQNPVKMLSAGLDTILKVITTRHLRPICYKDFVHLCTHLTDSSRTKAMYASFCGCPQESTFRCGKPSMQSWYSLTVSVGTETIRIWSLTIQRTAQKLQACLYLRNFLFMTWPYLHH
jgi:hypothetical protein